MNKIVDYLKNYMGVISIVLAVCMLLTYSLSYFKVNTESKRAAEMYIGELKYTLSIDGTSTNTLTVPVGETIVDIDLTNLNEIKTYYKLLYLNNSNISISYFNQTKSISNEVTSYKSPSDSVESKAKNILKLKIENNSTSKQTLTFKVSGGYSTNTLADVEVPNTYTEITTLASSSNTYFCKTNDTLVQGLEYVNGQYTYRYKQQGYSQSSGLAWSNMTTDGWGVMLTDRNSTDPANNKVCTYINDKPLVATSAMYYSSKATSIDLSFDTSNVTNMDSMFYSAKATTLDVSKLDTSNVTNMYCMFYMSSITTLNGLENLDTSKVTDMGLMFSNNALTELDLSNFNTSNVESMYGLFYSSKVTSLDLSNFNTSKVTDMSKMFQSSSIAMIDLSGFDMSNVTNMNGMFNNSYATTINLSNSNMSKVKNMGSMFYNSKATTIDLSGTNTVSATDMSSMFYMSQATTINLDNFVTKSVTNMSAMFSSSKVTSLDLSGFDTSKVTNMRTMFWGSQATTIDVSGFNTSNVTNMKGMFGNTKATFLNVSYFNTSKVTDMSQMFYQSQVKTLDLASFDTSSVIDMSSMFQSATSINKIYVTNKFVTSNVTSSGNMFISATSLVGGAGTVYDNTKVDKTYAKIDGGTSNPGYFTEAPVPSSFSTDSWETIIYAVRKGDTSKYNVGDTKTVNFGLTYGNKILRIANKSTPSECKNSDFSQSACGFVLEFTEIPLANARFATTAKNNNGWPALTIYSTLNTTLYNAFPDELKDLVIDTKTVSGHGNADNNNFVSNDKLYLLSLREVFGDAASSQDTAFDFTRQLDYYMNNGSKLKSYNSLVKQWWLRTPNATNSTDYYVVDASGNPVSTRASVNAIGASPAFRIG